jgi:hypothetical protein
MTFNHPEVGRQKLEYLSKKPPFYGYKLRIKDRKKR